MQVQSIAFQPDAIEVTYIEERDIGERHACLRTLVFEAEPFQRRIDELQDDLREFVDDILVGLRNLKKKEPEE